MTDVLYIEDNANEADVFTRLMRKKLQLIEYKIACSGAEIVQCLNEPDGLNNCLPRLILMDINMSGMDGFDVIKELRNNSQTQLVPIIAFSTSDSPNDVRKAYQLGVNAYLIKPGGYQSTGELLERTFAFWLADNIRSY